MSWQCWKLVRCKWWKVGAPGLIPGEPPRYKEQVWMNAGQCTPTDDGQWGRTQAMSRQYQWLQSWYWGDWGGWNGLWYQRLRWGLKTPEEWTCRCQKNCVLRHLVRLCISLSMTDLEIFDGAKESKDEGMEGFFGQRANIFIDNNNHKNIANNVVPQ